MNLQQGIEQAMELFRNGSIDFEGLRHALQQLPPEKREPDPRDDVDRISGMRNLARPLLELGLRRARIEHGDVDVGRAQVLSGVDGRVIETFLGRRTKGAFGSSIANLSDVNGDGTVDGADLGELLANWTG